MHRSALFILPETLMAGSTVQLSRANCYSDNQTAIVPSKGQFKCSKIRHNDARQSWDKALCGIEIKDTAASGLGSLALE